MNHRSILPSACARTGAAPALANPVSTRRHARRLRSATPRTTRPAGRRARSRAQQPRAPQAPQVPAVVPPRSPQAPAAPNGAHRAADRVQRIQDFYDRTTNFQADFTRCRAAGSPARSSARAASSSSARPHAVELSTNGDVIVSNGTTLLAYQDRGAAGDRAVADAVRRCPRRSRSSRAPGASPTRSPSGCSTPTSSSTRRVRAGRARRRRSPPTSVSCLRRPRELPGDPHRAHRCAGNTNRIEFRNPQVNLDVPESTFSWRPPADVRIVRP